VERKVSVALASPLNKKYSVLGKESRQTKAKTDEIWATQTNQIVTFK